MLVTCVLLCGFVSVRSELAGSKATGRPVKKLLGVIKVKNGGCLDLGSDSGMMRRDVIDI